MSRFSRLTQSMNGKLVVLTSVSVIGFVIFAGLSIATLNVAKVHGPHYERVVQNKDLLADVLPPPNYIVETYLTAQLMVDETDPAKLDALIKHYHGLKKEYAERQQHWRENLADGDLKTEINERSRVPAEQFFAILDAKLIPALQAGEQVVANKLLAETLPPLYQQHRDSVDTIVSTTIENASQTESAVADVINWRQRLMWIVGLLAAGSVIGFAYWLSHSVRVQEREIARVQSMMEQAPINVMFADTDFIIQYMNPASLRTLKSIEEHLPVRAEEVVGQSIDVFHKNPSHQRRVLADPSNLPVEREIQVGNETLNLRVNPVFDQAREYLGAMVTWEVISERLEMERKIKDQADQERRHSEETQRKVDVILEIVNSVADGKFDVEFPDLGNDGIGQVSSALSRAVGSVRDALIEVRDVSTTVATASTQMSSAAEEISRGAQQQAARLEETASSLEEITTTVKQNSDNAQEARALAHGSRDVATDGGQVVGDAVQAMREINESSKQISDIITTIDEIAFQTNLLALNAAVEAARAGEQGRGFAVVASEVRNLAQRSASSAKEIKSLIQDSANKVEKGTDLVNKSGETLGEIVDSVKRVTDIVAEIAAASQEQLTGIEQVTKAVTQIDQLTQANASQTEEMAGTSGSVLNHARQLDDMVSRFDLGADARARTTTASASVTPAVAATAGSVPGADSGSSFAADSFMEF